MIIENVQYILSYILLIPEPFLEAIPQVVIALVYQCHIALSHISYGSKIQVTLLQKVNFEA